MWSRWLLLGMACVAVPPLFHATVGTPRFDRPLPQTPLPAVDDVVRRVDAAWSDAWRRAGLTPTPPADDLTVVRRLSLALLGRSPSLEEIRRLEAESPVDRLEASLGAILADRGFADYFAERLARATVGTDDGPTILYRRRRYVAWLADQLYANRPYDEIVRHLIADAGIWTDTPAVNFVTIAIKPDSDQDPDPKKLAARVSRAFLGVRLDCAECHNHPFEPWKQRDFQALAAFFAQTRRTGLGIADRQGEFTLDAADVADGHPQDEKQIIPPAAPYQPELLPSHGTRRERLAAWVTNPANQPFARAIVNRVWAVFFGRGLASPVDNVPLPAELGRSKPVDWPDQAQENQTDLEPTSAEQITAERATIDILSQDFVEHGFDLRRLMTAIVATRAFRLDSRGESDEAPATEATQSAGASFPLTRLRPEQVAGSLLQAASLNTISYESHIVVRIARQLRQSAFIKQYGDLGADEFDEHTGAMPQRLLMMNGDLVHDRTKDSILGNAATQIAALTPDDARAVEVAMLAVLTRRPTLNETEHFTRKLHGLKGRRRHLALEDIYWTLLNSTEFAWNH